MRKFGRKKGIRKLFRQSLAHNLIMRGKITTTEARAKEIRPYVEKLITIARKKQLAGFRILLSRLPKISAEKLFYEIAPRFTGRPGGYLRIIKTASTRKRDAAPLTVIEFIA